MSGAVTVYIEAGSAGVQRPGPAYLSFERRE